MLYDQLTIHQPECTLNSSKELQLLDDSELTSQPCVMTIRPIIIQKMNMDNFTQCNKTCAHVIKQIHTYSHYSNTTEYKHQLVLSSLRQETLQSANLDKAFL